MVVENVGPLLSGAGEVVTEDADRADVLSDILVSVFTNEISQTYVIKDTVQGGEE